MSDQKVNSQYSIHTINVRGNQQRKTKGERKGDSISQREIALLTVTLQAAGGMGKKEERKRNVAKRKE